MIKNNSISVRQLSIFQQLMIILISVTITLTNSLKYETTVNLNQTHRLYEMFIQSVPEPSQFSMFFPLIQVKLHLSNHFIYLFNSIV